MSSFDLLRVAAFIAASATFALALANLIISFEVLKPRPFTWRNFAGNGGGFIWTHILAVTIPFQGFEAWGMVEVAQRLSQAPTWRAPALLVLSGLISAGYVIIFKVELARLRLRRAVTDSVCPDDGE